MLKDNAGRHMHTNQKTKHKNQRQVKTIVSQPRVCKFYNDLTYKLNKH